MSPAGAHLVFIVAAPEDDAGMMGESSNLVYDLCSDIVQKVLDITRNKETESESTSNELLIKDGLGDVHSSG